MVDEGRLEMTSWYTKVTFTKNTLFTDISIKIGS
jgi:hypothetical protein